MSEVISCEQCQVDFHQSFLSGHVESYHVPPRQEDVVTLSCLSCSYSVPLTHKNAMVHHCYATGHAISSVETQFHNFLLVERARIDQTLQESFQLLKDNLDPKPSPKKEHTPETPKEAEKGRKSPTKRPSERTNEVFDPPGSKSKKSDEAANVGSLKSENEDENPKPVSQTLQH